MAVHVMCGAEWDGVRAGSAIDNGLLVPRQASFKMARAKLIRVSSFLGNMVMSRYVCVAGRGKSQDVATPVLGARPGHLAQGTRPRM